MDLRRTDHEAVSGFLRDLEAGSMAAISKAAPPGYMNQGWNGGPATIDAFRSRRAPSPPELVEAWKSVVYACSKINANGVAKATRRLYATTTSRQRRPRGAVKSLARPAERRLRESKAYGHLLSKAESVHEVVEHPHVSAIEDANPAFDGTLLMHYTSLCLDLCGSAYWQPDAGPLQVASAIWPLQAQYVMPQHVTGGYLVDYFQYFDRQYRPDELIHFREVSLKDPAGAGYGPTQAAFEYVGLGEKYVTIQEQLLGTGFRPSVVISPKDAAMPMGQTERRRAEAELNSRYSGAGAGRAWVSDGAVDVHTMSFPPGDLADLQISEQALARVANCFGVPVSLLRTEDVNLANAEAGNRQHATLLLEPRCALIDGVLTRWTRSESARLPRLDLGWDRCFWATDPIFGEDEERKAKIFDMKVKAGQRTINEWRDEDGLPPVTWGNEPWYPNTLRQPSEPRQAANEAKPASDAGPADGTEGEADAADDAESKALSKALVERVDRLIEQAARIAGEAA